MKYKITVGDVTAHETNNSVNATTVYGRLRTDSVDGIGKAAHKHVILTQDGAMLLQEPAS